MKIAPDVEWRCRSCDSLLGVQLGEQVYLKIRRLQYFIRGRAFVVMTVCRSCQTVNEIQSSEGLFSVSASHAPCEAAPQ